MEATRPTIKLTLIDLRKNVTFFFLSNANVAITQITDDTVTNGPNYTVGNSYKKCSFLTTAAKLVICARPVLVLIMKPTGFCMKLFAAKIHIAEIIVPIDVSQINAQWSLALNDVTRL
ncbi:hypothetical protein WP50_10770 [Lactiplantibacillus plantarum]|nr:hypothetical protein WP50_10770 [Lactiplantibacillus plantarum]